MSEGVEWGRSCKLYWYCCRCAGEDWGPALPRRSPQTDNHRSRQPVFLPSMPSTHLTALHFFSEFLPFFIRLMFPVLTLSNISPHPFHFPFVFSSCPSHPPPLTLHSITLILSPLFLIPSPHSLFYLVFSDIQAFMWSPRSAWNSLTKSPYITLTYSPQQYISVRKRCKEREGDLIQGANVFGTTRFLPSP